MSQEMYYFYLYVFLSFFFIEYLISVCIIDLSYCTFCCRVRRKVVMSDGLEAAIVITMIKANYIFSTSSLCSSGSLG